MFIGTLTDLHTTLHKVVYRMLDTVSTRSYSGNYYVNHDHVKDLISYEDYLQYKDFIWDLLLSHEAVQEVDYDDCDKEYSITLYRSFVKDYPDAEEEGITTFNQITNPLVVATYNGRQFSFTKEELDAASEMRYQANLEEDCLRHLHSLIWGVDDFSELGIDPEEDDDGAEFAGRYGVSIPHIEAMVPTFVNHFRNNYDCNTDENTLWRDAIEVVLDRVNAIREREAFTKNADVNDESVFNRIKFCGEAASSHAEALKYLERFVLDADLDAVSFMRKAAEKAEKEGEHIPLFGRGSCLERILGRFGFYPGSFGDLLVKEF